MIRQVNQPQDNVTALFAKANRVLCWGAAAPERFNALGAHCLTTRCFQQGPTSSSRRASTDRIRITDLRAGRGPDIVVGAGSHAAARALLARRCLAICRVMRLAAFSTVIGKLRVF